MCMVTMASGKFAGLVKNRSKRKVAGSDRFGFKDNDSLLVSVHSLPDLKYKDRRCASVLNKLGSVPGRI